MELLLLYIACTLTQRASFVDKIRIVCKCLEAGVCVCVCLCVYLAVVRQCAEERIKYLPLGVVCHC